MESLAATSVPGIMFGNEGRCPEVFPTSSLRKSLAHYFSGGRCPAPPGTRAPFLYLGVLFGAIALSLPGRESCCQQWSRSATDSVKKGHRHACHCFSRGWAVGTPGCWGQQHRAPLPLPGPAEGPENKSHPGPLGGPSLSRAVPLWLALRSLSACGGERHTSELPEKEGVPGPHRLPESLYPEMVPSTASGRDHPRRSPCQLPPHGVMQ